MSYILKPKNLYFYWLAASIHYLLPLLLYYKERSINLKRLRRCTCYRKIPQHLNFQSSVVFQNNNPFHCLCWFKGCTDGQNFGPALKVPSGTTAHIISYSLQRWSSKLKVCLCITFYNTPLSLNCICSSHRSPLQSQQRHTEVLNADSGHKK